MNYNKLLEKQKLFEKEKGNINAMTLSSFERDFELTFTHESTAMEGNTLSLMETKVILEDGISVGGKHLREIYEVVNHKKAYRYVNRCISEGKNLDEKMIKDIHEILTENIMQGGIYRNQEVRISGAKHTPPAGNDMYIQIKNFYMDLEWKKKELNVIELSAWTHAEFVRIHPFIDGNGRTSRLIMNFQLMTNGFLPISIAKENRLEYYTALEAYAIDGNLSLFVELIASLEEQQLDCYIKLING